MVDNLGDHTILFGVLLPDIIPIFRAPRYSVGDRVRKYDSARVGRIVRVHRPPDDVPHYHVLWDNGHTARAVPEWNLFLDRMPQDPNPKP